MAKKKIVLFAFSEDLGIFVHLMLNAIDMKERGYETKIVIETKAARFVRDMMDANALFGGLFKKVKDQGLIDGVCRMCSAMTDSQQQAKEQNIKLLDEMNGHPSIAKYLEEGFTVLIF